MRKIYTPDKIKFLKTIYKGRHILEITKLFNKRFKMNAPPASVKNAAQKAGLKSGYKNRTGWNRKYFDVHINYLRRITPGRYYKEVAELFHKRFGIKKSAKDIATLCSKFGISNGISFEAHRFKKGQEPPNKGKKGYCAPGCEVSWFKKGHTPANQRPIGSERITVDGYVEVKFSNNNKPANSGWRAKHLLIWEKKHGRVPDGHVVVFLDGNKRNFSLDNLMMISRKLHYTMCRMHLYTTDREKTRTNILLYSVKGKMLELKRQTLSVIKCREIIFLNRNGHRVYVVKDNDKFYPVRETNSGEIARLRSSKFRPRKTRKEAQRDLFEYAQFYGWQRI